MQAFTSSRSSVYLECKSEVLVATARKTSLISVDVTVTTLLSDKVHSKVDEGLDIKYLYAISKRERDLSSKSKEPLSVVIAALPPYL